MFRPDRRHFSLLVAACAAATLSFPAFATLPARATTVDETTDVTSGPDVTANDFLDLERSLTECISSNPPPGCGRVPTNPGDRGGWQQLVLFGVMMGGIALIFWRVSRAVRSRDTFGGPANEPENEPRNEPETEVRP